MTSALVVEVFRVWLMKEDALGLLGFFCQDMNKNLFCPDHCLR